MTRLGIVALGVAAATSMVSATDRSGGRPSWGVAILPSGAEVAVEIVADPAARARGLMGRATIGPKEGMLFVFERSARHGFWMKNCLVALDILWLDEAFRIVDLARSVPPCPPGGDCEEVIPKADALYVLELAAGAATRNGLDCGQRVVVLSEPPLP